MGWCSPVLEVCYNFIMKNPQKSLIIRLSVLVIVLLVIVGGIFIYAQWNHPTVVVSDAIMAASSPDSFNNQPADNVTPVSPATTSASVGDISIPLTGTIPSLDISSWKTYTNATYGFSIKYPSGQMVANVSEYNKAKQAPTSGIGIDSIEDISTASTDGACESLQPETLGHDKAFADAIPLPMNIMQSNSGDFSGPGYYKVMQVQSGARLLLHFNTCNGLADPSDSADINIEAEVFKGNTLVYLKAFYPFNASGNIKVQDLDKTALQIMDGKFNGPEQEYYNDFVNSLTTFQFTK